LYLLEIITNKLMICEASSVQFYLELPVAAPCGVNEILEFISIVIYELVRQKHQSSK
jgi:hypothetical protein